MPDELEAHLRAAGIAGGVYGSFFLFYSGYKKPNAGAKLRGLEAFKGSFDIPGELKKIFAPSNLGSSHSNRQLNKVAGLAGLTLAGLAALPESVMWEGRGQERVGVLRIAAASLVVHIIYSFQSFYKLSPVKLLKGQGKDMKFEQVATAAGSGAIGALLYATVFGGEGTRKLASAESADLLGVASLLGFVHFYFIETKDGTPLNLPVRPWGYLAFVVPAVAAGMWARKALA